MKVTSIDLYSSASAPVANFSFRDPASQNSYLVKGIDGLDADEIASSYYARGRTGKPYYNMSIGKRTIVVQVNLNPKYHEGESHESLRDNLYRAISASRTGVVQLRFNDGAVYKAYLEGTISKVEQDLFSKEPNVKITIQCVNSTQLLAPTDTVVPVGGFPVNAPVITDNESTAPHGLFMEGHFTGFSSQFTLSDNSLLVAAEWNFTTTGPAGGFIVGDILRVSSVVGERYLYLIRGGAGLHIVDRISAGSIWPLIFPGVNNLFLNNTTAFQWDSIKYRKAYWGV